MIYRNILSAHRLFRLGVLCTATVLLSACASSVPLLIRTSPPGAPPLSAVRTDTQAYLHQTVRWGGVIIHTQNHATLTRLIILGRRLDSDGQPATTTTNAAQGRFIAIVHAFLDPAIYTPGRRVTVRGTVQGMETHKVNHYPYHYPVVSVRKVYLWPLPPPPYTFPPYWDAPFWYNPWYPFYAPNRPYTG